MLDWSVLQWLDAGQTPLMVLIAYFLWKIERRVYKLELTATIEKAVSEAVKSQRSAIGKVQHTI